MTCRTVEKPHPRFHRTGFVIGGGKIKAADAGMRNGTGAHRARLQRHPQVAIIQPFRAARRHGRTKRQHFSMVQAVGITLHPVLRQRNDATICCSDRGGHRHFTGDRSSAGFLQQKRHDIGAL